MSRNTRRTNSVKVWGMDVQGLPCEIGYRRTKAYRSPGESGKNELDSQFGERSPVGWTWEKGRTSAPPPGANVEEPKVMKYGSWN